MIQKVMHIVGNRPQFIKLAPLSHELNKRGYEDIILHTGQHYDENMSDVFFYELGIKKPYKNLNIGSGSHAETTARALIAIEKELTYEKPSVVILYGDTNSTLAAALAAVKLHIPIVHVEAGPRAHDKNNPEECNRIITDHMASLLCCPDQASVENLKKEGIGSHAYFTGDIMYDTFLYSAHNSQSDILKELDVENDKYILMTWHRQENTDAKERMEKIVNFLRAVHTTIICPMHPRTKKKLKDEGLEEKISQIRNLKIIEPVGYFEMVKLMRHSSLILTDSGGLSKESYFAGSKCLFMIDLDIWPELIQAGWITKIDFDNRKCVNHCIEIANKAEKPIESVRIPYFGEGNAAVKIVDLIERG